MAVAFLPVFYSKHALNDTVTMAPVAIGLVGCLFVYKRGRTVDWIWAGAAIGVACAVKYTAGALLIALLIAAALRVYDDRRQLRSAVIGLVIGGACFFAAFAILNPFGVLHPGELRSQVSGQSSQAGTAKLGQDELPGWWYYLGSVTWGLGWVPLVAAIGGGVVIIRRDWKLGLLLVVFPILFWLYMSTQTRHFGRWLMPIYPSLCILAGIGAVALIDRLRWRPAILTGILAVLLCGQGLAASVHIDRVFGRADTRTEARRWMVKQHPGRLQGRDRAVHPRQLAAQAVLPLAGAAALSGLREAPHAPARGPVPRRRLLLGRRRQPPEGSRPVGRPGQRLRLLPGAGPRLGPDRDLQPLPQGRQAGALLLRRLVQLPPVGLLPARPRRRDPPPGGVLVTIAERFERHWSKAWGWALVCVGVLGALGVFVGRPTYPNYDTYYTLVWGQEIYGGHLPDYHVFRPPTPHPLATFVGWLAAPFGTDGDRLLVLASLLLFVGLLVIVFRFTQRLLGSLVALVAVLAVLTRTDVEFLALRAMADLPFYVLVFGAAAYELRRPRSGWPVLVLLAVAGLLRPEAWLLSGAYWLYLIPVTSRPQLVRLALLVVAAPVIWLAADTIVEHAPLYSLTETRDVAGQIGRNRTVFQAIGLIPDHLGATDKVINFGVGGLGFLLALALLRERALIPLALGALGVVTFLIIVAAGLSAIPRYLTVPSLLLTMCVAVALTGWTVARERWLRIAAIAVAVISVLAIARQLPQLNKDRRTISASGDVRQPPAPRPVRGARPAQGRAADPGPPLLADHDADALGDPGRALRDRAAQVRPAAPRSSSATRPSTGCC